LWKRPSSSAEAGLTLLELLVAMLLAAVVGMAVYAMHDSAMGAYQHAREARRAGFGLNVMVEVLNDDLRSIYTGDGADSRFSFQGKAVDAGGEAFLEFSCAASLDPKAGTNGTEIRRVRYTLAEGKTRDSYDLVREERSPFALKSEDRDDDYEWRGVILARDVGEVEAAYFDDLNNSFQSEWQTEPALSNRPLRPAAVQLSLAKSDEETPTVILIQLPPARYLYHKP